MPRKIVTLEDHRAIGVRLELERLRLFVQAIDRAHTHAQRKPGCSICDAFAALMDCDAGFTNNED